MTDTRRAAGADDRNRQARGDRRRQQILDAAVELFATKGYRGTGVASLAQRVEMTATGLLYYFGSKKRLLQEVVAERDHNEVLAANLDLRLSDLAGIGDHNAGQSTLTKLFAVLGAESFEAASPLHDFFVDRYEATRSFMAGLVRSEQARGAVRGDVDADQISREIVSTIIGLEAQWLMDPRRVDYPATVRAYIERLVRDLAR